MRFDYIIGNPPYQDETLGDNKGFAPPIYNLFMEGAYKVADRVELIHPARFLFNAGSTPKAWNQKMLADPHLKVVFHEQNSGNIFSNTDIKGGVAITYRDVNKDYGAIGTFTPYDELNSILHRVTNIAGFQSLSTVVVSSYAYHFTDEMHRDFPNAAACLSKGHAYDLKSNIFERIPFVFFDTRPNDGDRYIKILGREKNERVYKFIKASYVATVRNLDKYKIFLPKANGIGQLGEVLSSPVVASPGVGSTETFLSIGSFETENEAENALLYIRTKFARTLLSVLKTTQDLTPEKWKHVPLQDFTKHSDIDWSRPISEIDRQLYKKYGLNSSEIEFIESHVKEMT